MVVAEKPEKSRRILKLFTMKDFIDIKDVEVNNMKKKELLEANGGYVIENPSIGGGYKSIREIIEEIMTGGGMTGYAPSWM